jgi:hyperosmotically inducible protein
VRERGALSEPSDTPKGAALIAAIHVPSYRVCIRCCGGNDEGVHMQETNTRRPRLRPIAAVAAAMAVAALAACNRPADDRTAREPAEPPIAKTERQPQGMQDDSRSPSASPGATPGTGAAPNTGATPTERATNDVSDKVKDAAITTAVNAKLAQDKTLSAMRIDVDTVDGKVSLRGTAPDPSARERATTLASAVDGVVSVDNQLVVSGKG